MFHQADIEKEDKIISKTMISVSFQNSGRAAKYFSSGHTEIIYTRHTRRLCYYSPFIAL